MVYIIRSHVTTVIYSGSGLGWHIQHADDDDRFKGVLPIGMVFILSCSVAQGLAVIIIAFAREANDIRGKLVLYLRTIE